MNDTSVQKGSDVERKRWRADEDHTRVEDVMLDRLSVMFSQFRQKVKSWGHDTTR
jgi:hypothetical protein